jgi:gamma-glutamylcyclotransferase (GGCT)/AIG2-like uncharacterized protein YtfP
LNLFVYGTLRKKDIRSSFLENSKYLGEFVTQPKYSLYNLGSFPAITKDGDTAIIGEVYEIADADTLRQIDLIEGHPNFYTRLPIDLDFAQSKEIVNNFSQTDIDCEAYFLLSRDMNNYEKIITGDWFSVPSPF